MDFYNTRTRVDTFGDIFLSIYHSHVEEGYTGKDDNRCQTSFQACLDLSKECKTADIQLQANLYFIV